MNDQVVQVEVLQPVAKCETLCTGPNCGKPNAPRVMKRWTDDCKPKWEGQYWVKAESLGIIVADLRFDDIAFGTVDTTIDYCSECYSIESWLELEPAPILPEEGE